VNLHGQTYSLPPPSTDELPPNPILSLFDEFFATDLSACLPTVSGGKPFSTVLFFEPFPWPRRGLEWSFFQGGGSLPVFTLPVFMTTLSFFLCIPPCIVLVCRRRIPLSHPCPPPTSPVFSLPSFLWHSYIPSPFFAVTSASSYTPHHTPLAPRNKPLLSNNLPFVSSLLNAMTRPSPRHLMAYPLSDAPIS